MKRYAVLKGIGTIVFGSVLFCNSSFAYELEGYKMPATSTSYKWGSNLDSGSSVIKTGFIDAMTNWENKTVWNDFFYNSNSLNTLNSWYEVSSSYYGRNTSYGVSDGVADYFKSEVNSGNSNITKINVAKSTATHELGHAMGIDHNDINSIMNSARNREVLYMPQTDDINGIAAIY
ncbi:peptidase [Fictibacillus barbaricus]|nr:M57 family metalloprotease [Fictibacillus barbaricus]GGB72904.1 peptidase [Fictibacillus barbaricus]